MNNENNSELLIALKELLNAISAQDTQYENGNIPSLDEHAMIQLRIIKAQEKGELAISKATTRKE